jgi:hypothetical protein
MKYFFCTYFDRNFLPRGLTLVDSLKKHCPSFKIFILCLDDFTFDYLSGQNGKEVHPIRLTDLEKYDKDLFAAKQNRSKIEYFFTLSPCLPIYILKNFPEAAHITYLDSDLYFFSDPKPIYDELGDKSILIIPHRFPSALKDLEIYGLFNVGFQIFKNDEAGLNCLHRWRSQCIECCKDELEGGRFADQKYLDEWPHLYAKSLVVCSHPGANLAPWNVSNYELTREGESIRISGQPLIFYHFQRLRFIKKRLVTHGLDEYKVYPNKILKDFIYAPYLGALIRKNEVFSHFTDKTERLTQKYSIWQMRKHLKYGRTFFYINDKWCFRFKWKSDY